MSYDIYFYRPRAGVKLSDVVGADYEDRAGLVSAIPEDELSSLADRVAEALPDFEVMDDDGGLVVAPSDEEADLHLEVLLLHEECSIGFPYGQDAKKVFDLARKAAAVMTDFGLLAHDPQLDGDFDAARAVKTYEQVSRDLRNGKF